jgi:hypothetical protein
MDFFLGGRLDRILELRGSVPGSSLDEIWVSAHDLGSRAVEGGRVLGMRVVVTSTLPAGTLRMWSDVRKEFLS